MHFMQDSWMNIKWNVNLHGGGFSSSIVTQKRSYLPLIEAKCQSINC